MLLYHHVHQLTLPVELSQLTPLNSLTSTGTLKAWKIKKIKK